MYKTGNTFWKYHWYANDYNVSFHNLPLTFKGSQEDSPNIVEDAEVDAAEETQHCVDGNADYIRNGELESECSGEDANAESETEYQVSNEVSPNRKRLKRFF